VWFSFEAEFQLRPASLLEAALFASFARSHAMLRLPLSRSAAASCLMPSPIRRRFSRRRASARISSQPLLFDIVDFIFLRDRRVASVAFSEQEHVCRDKMLRHFVIDFCFSAEISRAFSSSPPDAALRDIAQNFALSMRLSSFFRFMAEAFLHIRASSAFKRHYFIELLPIAFHRGRF